MSFSSLEIGKRALLAQRLGLDVTSNNIANVNTPGYSRRAAILKETNPLKINGNYLGTGVLYDKLQSFRESYYDREVRNSMARLSNYGTQASFYRRVETVLAEPGDNGVADLITNFFKTFDELALKPESISIRSYLTTQSQTLTDRINRIAYGMQDLRNEALAKVNSNVTEINRLAIQITEINKQIAGSGTDSANSALTYIDTRENLLEELSKYVDINVGKNDDGTVNVFINGIDLVTSTSSKELRATIVVNDVTGEQTVRLFKFDKAKNLETDISTQGGEINANLQIFNVKMNEKYSGNEFSEAKDFHAFVRVFAQKVNDMMMGGYGLDDADGLPPMRRFFDPTDLELNAFNIRISDDIKNNPRDIPLSDSAGEPGNSTIAQAIARLAQSPDFFNNANPIEYFNGFLGKIGLIAREAENGYKTMGLINDQLNSQRESIMGVNLDEEAISLIKYQKAFEASSRIVSVTNELLATIVNLGR